MFVKCTNLEKNKRMYNIWNIYTCKTYTRDSYISLGFTFYEL